MSGERFFHSARDFVRAMFPTLYFEQEAERAERERRELERLKVPAATSEERL